MESAVLICKNCAKQLSMQIRSVGKFARVASAGVREGKFLHQFQSPVTPAPTTTSSLLHTTKCFEIRSAGMVGISTHTEFGNCTTTPHGPVVMNLTFEDVVYGLEHDLVHMLDVRHQYEIETTGKIGDAKVLPVQEIEEALDLSEEEFLEHYGFNKSYLKSKNLVVYCQTGNRALTAAGILLLHGYYGVKRYPGSWNEWDDKYDDDTTPMVHAGKN